MRELDGVVSEVCCEKAGARELLDASRSIMSSSIQSYGSAIVQAAISMAVSMPSMSLLEQLHTRRTSTESRRSVTVVGVGATSTWIEGFPPPLHIPACECEPEAATM
jgi:hypothetical protein